MEQKLTPRIASKYYGVKIIRNIESRWARVNGHFLGMLEMSTFAFKLELKRLCNISDADFIEVAKLCNIHNPTIVREQNEQCIIATQVIQLSKGRTKERKLKLYFTRTNPIVIDDKYNVIEYAIEVWDKLRELGYDCDKLLETNMAEEVK